MISLLSSLLGKLLYFVYHLLASGIGQEPKSVSFYALSVILTTIIFKLLLVPLTISQTKNQARMAQLQPEMKKIQKKYKNDPTTLAQKQQALYKEAGFNPLAGCLPLLIQFPILIAFLGIFKDPEKYAFTEPGFYQSMAKNFFYIQNLDHVDKTMILPILAAVTTFLVSYVMQKKQKEIGAGTNEQSDNMMKTMTYMMPLMILFWGRQYAAGFVLYWTVSNLFSLVQQVLSNRSIVKAEHMGDESL